MWRFRIILKWYDIWVGVFIDTKSQVIYVFPVPCLGLRIAYYRKDSKKRILDQLDQLKKKNSKDWEKSHKSESKDIYQSLINKHKNDQG